MNELLILRLPRVQSNFIFKRVLVLLQLTWRVQPRFDFDLVKKVLMVGVYILQGWSILVWFKELGILLSTEILIMSIHVSGRLFTEWFLSLSIRLWILFRNHIVQKLLELMGFLVRGSRLHFAILHRGLIWAHRLIVYV